MQQDFHSLSLFGLELAPWLQRWRAGWRELFWGHAAGIRRRLEAPVVLQASEVPPAWYIAEQPAAPSGDGNFPHYRAFAMPSRSVLITELTLPAAVEADLDEVMQLEAASNSPFAPEDTCHGWALKGRSGDALQLTLAISAVSEVRACLHAAGEEFERDEDMPEVWCADDQGQPVILQGFGEWRRALDYRRRLAWLGGLTGLAVLLCLALLLVPGLVRQMQADNMDYHYAQAEADASEAMRLREQLALNNERALTLQDMALRQYNYPQLLDSLTASAPDSVYLEQLGIEWGKVRMRGWGENAAAYLQALTENADFSEVRAPGAFRRHGRTQLEQFVLELTPAGSGQ